MCESAALIIATKMSSAMSTATVTATTATKTSRCLSLAFILTTLMVSSCHAQATPSPIVQGIMDLLRTVTQDSGSSNNTNTAMQSSNLPQFSLIETFGPVSRDLLSGSQTSPNSQTGSQTNSAQSQSSGTPLTSGAHVVQYFGGGEGGRMQENNDVSSSSSSGVPGSDPLGDDILRKISAVVNQPLSSTGSGNPMTSVSAMSPSGPGGLDMSAMAGGFPPYMGGMDPYGLNGIGMPPFGPSAGMMPGFPTPLSAQAMARRLSQKLGVKDYYDLHGCDDPALLLSGRQRAMAAMAMSHGCQSMQAAHVCRMVQAKERLFTSSVVPMHMKSRLETCLSAKVLLNTMSPSSFISSMFPVSPFGSSFSSPSMGSGVPSLRECGVLLPSVMDGGSLDPESMAATRRRLLPWVCNESTLGPSGLPYRVCCPGKVPEPTLQEAQIVRRMVNA